MLMDLDFSAVLAHDPVSIASTPTVSPSLAARYQEAYGVPVIEGVGAAVKQTEALVSLGLFDQQARHLCLAGRKPYTGALQRFSPALISEG